MLTKFQKQFPLLKLIFDERLIFPLSGFKKQLFIISLNLYSFTNISGGNFF